MAISFVGAASAAATSLTLPTHQAGDLLLLFAYRNGSTTPPTAPSGWTTINSGGGSSNSSRLAYRIATGAGTASGTWNNATHISATVYRAGSGSINVGAETTTGGFGNTLSFTGITLQDTSGTSWVAGFGGHRQATNVETAPTGMTNRTSTATTGGESAAHDTNTGTATWTTQTVAVSASSGWRTAVVEIREYAAITLAAAAGAFTLTGIATTGVVGLGLAGEPGSFTLAGQDVGWFREYVLHAGAGSYDLEGNAGLIGPPRSLSADPGSFTLAGQDVAFRKDKITPPWQPSRPYTVGSVVRPTIAQGTGLFFRCIVAGTSGAIEPFWPASIKTPVVDGSVTWLAVLFVADELQKPAPSAIIELFQLETTVELHGAAEVYRFHAGTSLNSNGDIVWAGETYQRFPVEASGFEYNGQGQLPRPKIRVSNVLSTISALMLGLPNGLEGAKVTRIRTLARYIDDVNFPGNINPLGTPDPTAEFPREVYFVDRKAAETKDVVEFELAAAFDLAGVRAPKRQCIANICQWKYRSAECGYNEPLYFNANDEQVTTAAEDVCGKRLSSCRIRFESIRRTGTVTRNSTTLNVNSTAGIIPGHSVAGFAIPSGATVSSITSATQLVMSAAATASNPTTMTGTVSSQGATMTVANGSLLVPGMTVTGPMIPPGTTIISISGNTVTLSNRPYEFSRVGEFRYSAFTTLSL